MSETKRVINDLNVAKHILCKPQMLSFEMNIRIGKAITNAIALLKEQEPVPPEKENDGTPEPCTSWWYVCGDCGQEIEYHDRFCRHCGQAVKWNES